MTADPKMLDRVRKLLAKAEHPSTPAPEAESMSAKAAELMARYTIDAAMLEDRDTTGAIGMRRLVIPAPYTRAKAAMLNRLARCYHVEGVFTLGGPDSGATRLYGFDADLDVVEMLFTSLLVQCTRAMFHAENHELSIVTGGSPRAFRQAFILAYAMRVSERVERATRRVEADAGQSTALVLADRSAQVKSHVAEAYPNLKTTRITSSNGNGAKAGRAAADRATIGHGAVGTRKALT